MAESSGKKNSRKKKVSPGILTTAEIREHGIVVLDDDQDPDEKCYSNASYDLRLGEDYFIPGDDAHPAGGSGRTGRVIGHCRDDNKVLRIKSFTSVVISTYEKVNMPANVAGRFDLRIQWALQGLILQVGTQIEPGYKGRLFGLLHNFSKKEILIPLKERLLTAEFSYTVRKAAPIVKNNRVENALDTLDQFLDKFPPVVGSLEHYLQEIQAIRSDINTSKESIRKEVNDARDNFKSELKEMEVKYHRNLSIMIPIAITVATLIMSIGLPLIVTKMTLDRDDYPFEMVYEIKEENRQMEEEIRNLKASIGDSGSSGREESPPEVLKAPGTGGQPLIPFPVFNEGMDNAQN